MATDVRTVLVTAADFDGAESLARAVVEERLAACVNIVPGVVSVFRWEGAVQREDEVLLVMKTTATRVEALRARILQLHDYDAPEVLVLPVEDGNEAYLRWVEEEVGAEA